MHPQDIHELLQYIEEMIKRKEDQLERMESAEVETHTLECYTSGYIQGLKNVKKIINDIAFPD